jgi:hypothetical protein
MARTREQIEKAAADAEAWLDKLDPATTPARDAADLRRIGLALIDKAKAESEIEEAVVAARRNGASWNFIAGVLGVSKQAAHERYGRLIDA